MICRCIGAIFLSLQPPLKQVNFFLSHSTFQRAVTVITNQQLEHTSCHAAEAPQTTQTLRVNAIGLRQEERCRHHYFTQVCLSPACCFTTCFTTSPHAPQTTTFNLHQPPPPPTTHRPSSLRVTNRCFVTETLLLYVF